MKINTPADKPATIAGGGLSDFGEFEDVVLLQLLTSIRCPDTSANVVSYPSTTNVPIQPWSWLAMSGGGSTADATFRPVVLNLAPCFPMLRCQLGITLNYLMTASNAEIEGRCRGSLTPSQLVALLARLPLERQGRTLRKQEPSHNKPLEPLKNATANSRHATDEEVPSEASLRLVRFLKDFYGGAAGGESNTASTTPSLMIPTKPKGGIDTAVRSADGRNQYCDRIGDLGILGTSATTIPHHVIPPSRGQRALTSMYAGHSKRKQVDDEHWNAFIDKQSDLTDPYLSRAAVDFTFVHYHGARLPPLDERLPIHVAGGGRRRSSSGESRRRSSGLIPSRPASTNENPHRADGSPVTTSPAHPRRQRTPTLTSFSASPPQTLLRDTPVESHNSLVRFWQRYMGISFKIIPDQPLMSAEPPANAHDDLRHAWIVYPAFTSLLAAVKCTPPEREAAVEWWENEALILRRLRQIEKNRLGLGRRGSALPTRTLTDIHGRKMLGVKYRRSTDGSLLPAKRGTAQYQAWLEATEIPVLAFLNGLETTLAKFFPLPHPPTVGATPNHPPATPTAHHSYPVRPHVDGDPSADVHSLSATSAPQTLPTHFLRQGFKRFTSSSPWYHIQFEIHAQLHATSPPNHPQTQGKSKQPDNCPRLLSSARHHFTPPEPSLTTPPPSTPPSPQTLALLGGGPLTSKELRLEALSAAFAASALAVHTFNDFSSFLADSPAATTAFISLAFPLMTHRPIPPLVEKKRRTATQLRQVKADS